MKPQHHEFDFQQSEVFTNLTNNKLFISKPYIVINIIIQIEVISLIFILFFNLKKKNYSARPNGTFICPSKEKFIGIVRVGCYTSLKGPITTFIGPTKASEIYLIELLRGPSSIFTRDISFII